MTETKLLLALLALVVSARPLTASEPGDPRPTIAAARVGLGPGPRVEWAVLSERGSPHRGKVSQAGSAAIGAFVGAIIGGAIYKFKRSMDNGRDTSPLLVLEFVAVGAAIGFMAAPVKK